MGKRSKEKRVGAGFDASLLAATFPKTSFRSFLQSCRGLNSAYVARLKRKKRNWAMFPERDCLLSGQQSTRSRRLLYDGLTSFLGSARSSTLRPMLSKWKKPCKKEQSKIRSEKMNEMKVVVKKCTFSVIWAISIYLSTEIPIYIERSIYESIQTILYLYPDRYVPMSDYADLFLYVLATSVSAPKKKVLIFQSYVVRDVTYVRSIRYHSFWCSMIHLRIMSRQFDPFDSYLPSHKRGSGAIGRITI